MGEAKRRGTQEQRRVEGIQKRQIALIVRHLKAHPDWKHTGTEQRQEKVLEIMQRLSLVPNDSPSSVTSEASETT